MKDMYIHNVSNGVDFFPGFEIISAHVAWVQISCIIFINFFPTNHVLVINNFLQPKELKAIHNHKISER